jgi:hypothetical protein
MGAKMRVLFTSSISSGPWHSLVPPAKAVRALERLAAEQRPLLTAPWMGEQT